MPWFNDFSARSLGPGVMENSLYISLFAISPEVQGQGLGRETMNQVIAWGDEKGWEMTLFDHEPELVSGLLQSTDKFMLHQPMAGHHEAIPAASAHLSF